ncbi:cysteine proteinase inhibitor 3-like isoform X1 [Triticum dicoccoides]|uniref:cysteine proteinase inhibitor 3-like isoform X1 n=1 Tax=Triticum dicoccoides TaxID=85692 RepID=UPI0000509954|nr:cysteine proteinase inhibitor 3-like isoform X1 [Triticum dicoccoides]
MVRRCGCSGAMLLALSLAVLLAASAVPGAAGFHLGGDESGLVRGMLAAVRERAEAEDAARFAVAEHNRKQGSALEFTRVVNAKRQVVAGTLHDLMVEVVDSGKKSMYKAKVWVKPWQNFKAVVEFRHAGDFQSESSVASDGSTGQAILKLSLQTDMAPKMHSNENTGLSVDSSSSQAHTV